MKTIMSCVILVVVSLFLISCVGTTGVGVRPITQCMVDLPDGKQISLNEFCAEVELTGRLSYICSLQKEHDFDPCYLHRGLEVASKEGLVLEGYTFEEFKEWADYTKDRVREGVSYGTLKTIVLAQFTKINRLVGAQVLLLGDMFLQIPQEKLIPDDDITLIISSIDDLVVEVRGLSIWL